MSQRTHNHRQKTQPPISGRAKDPNQDKSIPQTEVKMKEELDEILKDIVGDIEEDVDGKDEKKEHANAELDRE